MAAEAPPTRSRRPVPTTRTLAVRRRLGCRGGVAGVTSLHAPDEPVRPRFRPRVGSAAARAAGRRHTDRGSARERLVSGRVARAPRGAIRARLPASSRARLRALPGFVDVRRGRPGAGCRLGRGRGGRLSGWRRPGPRGGRAPGTAALARAAARLLTGRRSRGRRRLRRSAQSGPPRCLHTATGARLRPCRRQAPAF